MNFKTIFLLSISNYIFAQERPLPDYQQGVPGTKHKLNMVYIPSGSSMMGSPQSERGHFGDEAPKHEVQIDDFYMSSMEITWDLYNLFVSRDIDAAQPDVVKGTEVDLDVDGVSGATTPYVEMSFGMGVDGYPAICMTQLAAVKFCEWLSAMTGNFYRLPTEAEWEYACRAGTSTAYSFGDDPSLLDAFAWFNDNSNGSYHQVGQKKPNEWGLYDMHGNVAEWTLDQYYPTVYRTRKSGVSNPLEEPTKTYPRVVRGGSWLDNASRLRSAARRASNKKWKKRDPQIPKSLWWHTDAPFVGFRVVRPVKTPTTDEQKNYWNYKLTK